MDIGPVFIFFGKKEKETFSARGRFVRGSCLAAVIFGLAYAFFSQNS